MWPRETKAAPPRLCAGRPCAATAASVPRLTVELDDQRRRKRRGANVTLAVGTNGNAILQRRAVRRKQRATPARTAMRNADKKCAGQTGVVRRFTFSRNSRRTRSWTACWSKSTREAGLLPTLLSACGTMHARNLLSTWPRYCVQEKGKLNRGKAQPGAGAHTSLCFVAVVPGRLPLRICRTASLGDCDGAGIASCNTERLQRRQ